MQQDEIYQGRLLYSSKQEEKLSSQEGNENNLE
jgi:hypothetical protein